MAGSLKNRRFRDDGLYIVLHSIGEVLGKKIFLKHYEEHKIQEKQPLKSKTRIQSLWMIRW